MDKMKYILGPCAIEHNVYSIAQELSKPLNGKEWWFKASFDKANRTSLSSSRGPGLIESISIFKGIKKLVDGIKITTDVHETHQVELLSELVDMIQIPAFLCRQTDLLIESAKYFNFINIKKGQWLSPINMRHAVDKIKVTNPDATVFITERGTQFGYEKLLVDFSSVNIMKEFSDGVFLDCTHSTQRAQDGKTGGDRDLGKKYIQAAPIFGYDGIFAECHPNPSLAISDSDSQIELDWIIENI